MPETLDFTRDTLRNKYFVPESRTHNAKMELRTYRWLVERYTQPGDTILDPMSGIGTVHFAATMGRNTIGIEIEEHYAAIQHLNIAKLDKELGLTGKPMVINSDCRRVLPLPQGTVNAVIFSPPYGGALSNRSETRMIKSYGGRGGNVGNMTVYPAYLAAMKEIYRLCAESLSPGNILVTVCKDYIRDNERIYVSKDNVRIALEVGFMFEDWHRRRVASSLAYRINQHNRAEKGAYSKDLDIETEDLLVLKKV